MDKSFRQAIARVDVAGPQGDIRGTAFLVGRDLALTALHVVATCRDADGRQLEAPVFHSPPVVLTFPDHTTNAKVVENLFDLEQDWALLQCASPPPAVQPIALAAAVEDKAAWETYGFPDANPRDGMAQTGTIEHARGNLDTAPAHQLFSQQAAAGTGAPVRGLSGAPVIVDNAAVSLLRFALMRDGRTVAGTIYGCPIGLVLDRCGGRLPPPPRPRPNLVTLAIAAANLTLAYAVFACWLMPLRARWWEELLVGLAAAFGLAVLAFRGLKKADARRNLEQTLRRAKLETLTFGLLNPRYGALGLPVLALALYVAATPVTIEFAEALPANDVCDIRSFAFVPTNFNLDAYRPESPDAATFRPSPDVRCAAAHFLSRTYFHVSIRPGVFDADETATLTITITPDLEQMLGAIAPASARKELQEGILNKEPPSTLVLNLSVPAERQDVYFALGRKDGPHTSTDFHVSAQLAVGGKQWPRADLKSSTTEWKPYE